jgi:tRNA(Ile)-lysidine synthase
MGADPDTRALAAARDSGLVEPGSPLLVMLSGGADSVCLLDVALRLGADAAALHVNYGLRPEADADEAHCRALCERLGVPLRVERVTLPSSGNLQADARTARYRIAEDVALADFAAAHTADDQAETVVYRLAASPGRRALLGMRPRRGRLVRPLLAATRADTRAHCRAARLDWREDSSNRDPRFARARIRHEVLPVLEQLAPGAGANIVATSELLRAEADVLDELVDGALARLGAEPEVGALRALSPALARLAIAELAQRAGAPPPSAAAVDRILALGEAGGSASLDVGHGVRAIVEYGRLRFARAREGAVPAPATLAIPGTASFGGYEVTASTSRPAGDVALDAAAVGDAVLLRPWQPGDRMRPAGLGGTRKLQDLFTDRKVPREARPQVPIVVVDGEIAWVPGVAVGESFRARPGKPAVTFSATARASRDAAP